MAKHPELLLDASRMIWRRWAGRQPTGIDRVCLAYLDRFEARSRAVVQYRDFRHILDAASSKKLFRLIRHPGSDFRFRLCRILATALLRRSGPSSGLLYLNIGHTGLDAPGLADWVRRTGVRPVYFVHDLIPITHPQFCRAGEADRHRKRMLTVLDTAVGVIGNSQSTLDELALFADATGRTMPTAVPAWLGIDGRPNVPKPGPSNKPTFVVLGTIEARKNHMMLLEIWLRFVAAMGEAAPQLLILGQRGWESDDVFAVLDNEPRLTGAVREINDCSDADVTAQLAGACALLFPTLAEGFGLPLIEALAAGTPAIVSDLPVFREIGQGVPQLVAPGDAAAWGDMILAYCDADSPLRAAQMDRLKAFSPFTWDDHFDAMESWLADL